MPRNSTCVGIAEKSSIPPASAPLRSVSPILRTLGYEGVSPTPAITWRFGIVLPPEWAASTAAATAASMSPPLALTRATPREFPAIVPHRPDAVIRDSLRSQTGHVPQPLPALGCVERFGAVQTFYRPA